MLNRLKTINYHNNLIEILFKAHLGSISANLLVPMIMVSIMYGSVPTNILFSWLSAQIFTYIARVIITKKGLLLLSNNSNPILILKALKQYLFIIFINAFLIGISALFSLFYMDTINTMILIMLIFALLTGSLTTLTPIYHATFIFTGTILSIFIFAFTLLGDTPFDNLIILILLMYTFITLIYSYKIHKFISSNIDQSEELKEKNINFQHLLDLTMEAIVISDSKNHILDSNQAGVELFKVTSKDHIIGKNILEFVPKYELSKLQKALQRDYDQDSSFDLLKADGSIFPALASGKNMLMNGEIVRISVILDLTTIKKREQQLFDQSRLAQMGEMISMIAHQWRQPLSVISTTASNLQARIELDYFDLTNEEGRKIQNLYFLERLTNMGECVQNLTHTIDDFRNFYKPNKNKTLVKFDTVFQKAFAIIKASLENDNINIDYHTDVKEEIYLYDSEMIQVILNILKNAQDNFNEKKTQNRKLTIYIKDYTLSICDNAGGVKEEIIDKIFDPYFSTKDEKNGTGLGLYMSRLIVEDHHDGKLNVKNRDGGAYFNIELPIKKF